MRTFVSSAISTPFLTRSSVSAPLTAGGARNVYVWPTLETGFLSTFPRILSIMLLPALAPINHWFSTSAHDYLRASGDGPRIP